MAPNPEKREREGPNTGLGAELAKSWNVAPVLFVGMYY
jgi:hypothetical protein